MRAISIIFRRELGHYFRSPLGWIIAAAVLLVDGILFQSQALSGESQLSADVLEKTFFFMSGIPTFAGVLLSFRLLSEERQNHSMILLNTSPVRDSEIVLGKFFASLVFMGLLLIISIYMPLLIKVEGKITWSQILVGYLGLFLLGAAVLAIGMFASALTRYQIVAALLGALFVTLLCFTYPFAKKLGSPVSDVLEQIDLWWIHFQNGFMHATLNLKDVVFYLAVTYFFLLLSTKTLEAKRWQ
ncbi:MAG TPA: ABC transporter permease [Kofleriaceae bacterium]|nr:ABC transporter permease [Kofleriaceae bacterium]